MTDEQKPDSATEAQDVKVILYNRSKHALQVEVHHNEDGDLVVTVLDPDPEQPGQQSN